MSDTQQQIDNLRRQVESLMRDRVTPALADAADRAQAGVDEVSGRVRERPLAALLVAMAIGFVIGRAT